MARNTPPLLLDLPGNIAWQFNRYLHGLASPYYLLNYSIAVSGSMNGQIAVPAR